MKQIMKFVLFALIQVVGLYCIVTSDAASINDMEYQKFVEDSNGDVAIRIVLPDGGTGTGVGWEETGTDITFDDTNYDNVGIGTTSPVHKLHVVGDAAYFDVDDLTCTGTIYASQIIGTGSTGGVAEFDGSLNITQDLTVDGTAWFTGTMFVNSDDLDVAHDVTVGELLWLSDLAVIRDNGAAGDLEYSEDGGSSYTDFGAGSGGAANVTDTATGAVVDEDLTVSDVLTVKFAQDVPISYNISRSNGFGTVKEYLSWTVLPCDFYITKARLISDLTLSGNGIVNLFEDTTDISDDIITGTSNKVGTWVTVNTLIESGNGFGIKLTQIPAKDISLTGTLQIIGEQRGSLQ